MDASLEWEERRLTHRSSPASATAIGTRPPTGASPARKAPSPFRATGVRICCTGKRPPEDTTMATEKGPRTLNRRDLLRASAVVPLGIVAADRMRAAAIPPPYTISINI